MSIQIGDEVFRTTVEARKRASAVLHRHPQGFPITGSDVVFVSALFWRHPRALEKAGAGVHHFEVRPGPQWPTPNLWVIRIDGSMDNFSIRTCIAGTENHQGGNPHD